MPIILEFKVSKSSLPLFFGVFTLSTGNQFLGPVLASGAGVSIPRTSWFSILQGAGWVSIHPASLFTEHSE
jgi:hypothetical protein